MFMVLAKVFIFLNIYINILVLKYLIICVEVIHRNLSIGQRVFADIGDGLIRKNIVQLGRTEGSIVRYVL